MRYADIRQKRKLIASFIFFFIFVSLCVVIYLMSTSQTAFGYNKGYEPDQPIAFSHKLHAGDYGIDCRYCHTAVEQGKPASVPSLDICMNCHLSVKVQSPLIQNLRKTYEEKKPVAWQKVHLLPDFVKFNHSLHIKALAGRFSVGALPPSGEQFRKTCHACHGRVEVMDVMYQKESLSMGWCVQCHRKPENQAPINCSTCHY